MDAPREAVEVDAPQEAVEGTSTGQGHLDGLQAAGGPPSAEPLAKRRKSRADPAKAEARAVAKAAAAVAASAAAVDAALAEGLKLVRSHGSACGYKNVINNKKPNSTKPWLCTVREPGNGKKTKLGLFSSKEEAALCYARHIGPAAADEMEDLYLKTAPMTPEAAQLAAAAEGLTLQRAPGTASGWVNVSAHRKDGHRLSYHAYATDPEDPMTNGPRKYLGCFRSGDEAALAVARYLQVPALPPSDASPSAHAAVLASFQKREARKAEIVGRRAKRAASQVGRAHRCGRCGELRRGHICREDGEGLAAAVLVQSIAPAGTAADGLLQLAQLGHL